MSKAYERRLAKADPKGDRRAATTFPSRDRTSGLSTNGDSLLYLQSDGFYSLGALLARADGWVRLTGDIDMKALYLKYKWNSGTHRGYYVMVVCTPEQLPWGLCLLYEKTLRVDRSDLRPTLDKAYEYQ